MIIVYDENKEITEMFDTVKEFKMYLHKEASELNQSMREDGVPTDELINTNNFHDTMDWFLGMGLSIETK